MTYRARSTFFVSLAITSGCTQVDSKNIPTTNINADTEVIAQDSTTTVTTLLRNGVGIGAGSIVLSAGDELSATLGGETVRLVRLDTNRYTGVLNSSDGGAEMTVALLRDNDPDAATSTVVLPARFEISAPVQDETFRTGDSVTASWSPSDPGNPIAITYTFNCKPVGDDSSPLDDVRTYTVDDNGTHTTTVTDILNARGPQPIINGEPCPVEMEIHRRSYGELDDRFAGGGIDAIRSKTLTITVIP